MSDPSPSSEPGGLGSPCPRCGAVGAPGDRYCELDGTPLFGAAAGAPASPDAAACPCGAAEDDGDGYCARCGHRLVVPRAATPDHQETVLGDDFASVSDRGLQHTRNEDAVALARVPHGDGEALVAVVCDGVSGSRDGDRAALLAANTARDALVAYLEVSPSAPAPEAMRAAITAAHAAICAANWDVPTGEDPPGTTLAAALVAESQVHVGWVGDSRVYLIGLEPAAATLLTHDHSLIADAIAEGKVSIAQAMRLPAAHVLTHCLGPLEQDSEGAAPEPGLGTHPLPAGAGLLVCSDGLWNYLAEPAALAEQLGACAARASARAIAGSLVEYALAQGGVDNVTVAVALLGPLLAKEGAGHEL